MTLRTILCLSYKCFVLINRIVYYIAREDYWTELVIWLLIWVPLDLRWYYKEYFYGAGFMAYDWWALVGQ